MTASRELITLLQRGGTYGHWWCQPGKRSNWWPVSKPSPVPRARLNVYFGVHPCEVIPETNRKGEPTPPEYVRSQIAHIQAINCFFAEYDSKDYAGDMPACLAHVRSLEPAPSAIVCSGGGYHAYWIFTDPWCLDAPETRQQAATLQSAWVVLMGGDTGAKDLARVLRVPGTKNYKYTPPESVQVIHFDRACLYDRAELIALAEPFVSAGPVSSATNGIHPNYAKAALADETAKALLAKDGTKHAQLYKSAAALGELVGAHALDRQTVRGMLLGAIEGRAVDIQGAIDTIEDGIDKGASNPRRPKPPAVTGQVTSWSNLHAEEAEKLPARRPRMISSLMAQRPDPVVWYAGGFVREGLGLFIGEPGVGKTPALMQLAIALATGTHWLNAVPCKQTKVLYWGIEYTEKELYPLIKASLFGRQLDDEWFTYLTLDDGVPDTPEQAINELEYYIRVLGYRVIVLDVFTGFLPPEAKKQNVYRGDYKEFQPYHRLAMIYSSTILGSWHSSKREADPRLMYNGSTGLWAVPSTRITMYRDDQQRVRISSAPRLADRIDWALTQEKTDRGHRWVVADADPEPVCSPTELQIYRFLKNESSKAHQFGPTTVAEMVNIPAGSAKTLLLRMFERNIIQRQNGYFIEHVADVANVANVASVTHVADVADVANTLSYKSYTTGYMETEQQEASNTPGYNGYTTTAVTSDIFANMPADKATILRVYLRSNKDSDHDRARELCDQFEISYNDALAEINKVKE